MKYSMTAEGRSRIEISVGELCFLAERSGDLDYRSSADKLERMARGTRLHKMLSRRISSELCDAEYRTEVCLSDESELCDVEFSVFGRADGMICYDDGRVVLDEYKTTGYEVKYASSLHLAQLKCYAHMLCKKDQLSSVEARLIYCPAAEDTATESDLKIKTFRYVLDAASLEKFYNSLLCKMLRYARHEETRRRYILPSASELPFPYKELRKGQNELIRETYRCIKRGERLFVQAPTGIGKTISTLYPAVRALGNGLCDKIFYLTAKSSTRREAYNAAARLFSAGAHFRTVVLSPKSVMCFRENNPEGASYKVTECDSDSCPFAKGYNDRVLGAIDCLLATQNCFTRGVITEIAKRYRVCPYELSLDLSEYCDLVICDYNYVFDPMVYLRRYFSAEKSQDSRFVFLADEAHNLPERARDMYSSSLSCKAFEKVYCLLPSHEKKLIGHLGAFITAMRRLRALCKNEMMRDGEGLECAFRLDKELYLPFIESVSELAARLDKWQRTAKGNPNEKLVREMSFELHKFLKIAEIYDEAFLNYIELSGGDVKFKIFCLDPSHPIEKCLKKAVSSVFFSATLTPPEYFADVLGNTKKKNALTLPSPFTRDNLCISAVTNVSTRFEDRKKSVKSIANYIAHTVCHRRGNYIVYFPSYAYLKEVREVFSQKYPNVPLIVQKPGMSASERSRFIESFPEDTGRLRVGFCVLGGSFSEGIDLPGTRLIGTVIVGLGLPGLSNERNIIRDYFENKYERGYDYAYTYPGMNNVLQAAGRVIRREGDMGVVVLIDDRYGTEVYKELFPQHWSHLKFASSSQELSSIIDNFWKNR